MVITTLLCIIVSYVKILVKMFDEVISWLNSNSSVATAIATAVLATITFFYLITTQKILKEQEKNRKINFIQRQLEKFYIPLQSHISEYKDNNDGFKVRTDTRKADFIIYLGLCQDEYIVGHLNEIIDPTSSSGAASHLKRIEKRVNMNIQKLKTELRELTK